MLTKIRIVLIFQIFLFLSFILTGCIRIWGGAAYARQKTGDYVEKTYVLDTARIGEDKSIKGSVQR